MHYTFLNHILSGELWAARVEDSGRVVAVCGPLSNTDVSDSRLPEYPYQTEERVLADFNEHPDDFRWGLIPDAAEPR